MSIGKLTIYSLEDLIKEAEKLSGRKIDDWTGVHEWQEQFNYETGDFPLAIWCISKGYDWRVLLDVVAPNGKKIAKSAEDFELRKKKSRI